MALETEFSEAMHRYFWLYWRLYDTKVPARMLESMFANDRAFRRIWWVLRQLGLVKPRGDEFVLKESAAFWLHLMQNHFLLDYINTVWSRGRAEPFPQRFEL